MLVPYQLTRRGHSGIVGTAFDYLARALIARYIQANKRDFFYLSSVAKGLDRLKQFPGVESDAAAKIQRRFEESLQQVSRFIEGEDGLSPRDIATACGHLARLDHVARQGLAEQLRMLEWTLDVLTSDELPEIVDELDGLARVFQKEFIDSDAVRPDSAVVFNPCFRSSPLLKGADADIVIDGTLYDFKTTKDPTYLWQDAAQLWGYYLLSVDHGLWVEPLMAQYFDGSIVFDPRATRIERIAFNKARFGEIEYVDVDDIDKTVKDDAVERFDEYLRETAWF